MPSGDRTGPWGFGPKTGRALGYCVGYNIPGNANFGYNRGFIRGLRHGFGRGFRGRGRGFWWRGIYPNPAQYNSEIHFESSRENEKAYLEDMVKNLEKEMEIIQERLKELSKEKKDA